MKKIKFVLMMVLVFFVLSHVLKLKTFIMKNIKNIKLTIISFFIVGLTSCKAQIVEPLNKSAYSTPTNSYFKDLNNELDIYIGTWHSSIQGKELKLKISKELRRPYEAWNKVFYKDVLIITYEVKSSTGSILQSTLDDTFPINGNVKNLMMSVGTNIRGNNELNLVYAGGNCSIGAGEITLKSINTNQFYWSYYPGSTTLNDITCPPNRDYNIY